MLLDRGKLKISLSDTMPLTETQRRIEAGGMAEKVTRK
jgi:hypothetical protein